MDSALIMAATTALVRHQLENALVEADVSARLGSDVIVSALPPDRISLGEEERPQLNVYLYRTRALSLDAARRDQSLEPGMAWEMSYLLTAYGAQDLQIEILLGSAVEQLRRVPCLDHAQMSKILGRISSTRGGKSVPAPLQALNSKDLAQRLQKLDIKPVILRPDETMQLWSMLQATYRPCVTYTARVEYDDLPAEEKNPS